MVPQPPLPNERYAIKAADGHACIGDGVHSSPMGLSPAAGKVIGARANISKQVCREQISIVIAKGLWVWACVR